jgi:hypothetical protein
MPSRNGLASVRLMGRASLTALGLHGPSCFTSPWRGRAQAGRFFYRHRRSIGRAKAKGIRKVARDLGLDKDDVQRAVKVASITVVVT